MKIFQQGQIDISKRTIFIDADDVILDSRTAALNILNKKFNTNKTVHDIKDWSFKSISRDCTQATINEVFESQEFWNTVTFQTELLNFLQKDIADEAGVLNNFNWIIITKGTEKNLEQKYNYFFNTEHKELSFLKSFKNKIGYYRLLPNESKSNIHMISRLQIDDNYKNLKNSDASVKILLKNELETDYNDISRMSDNLQNLYVVENMEQLFDTLKFIAELEFLEITDLQPFEDFNFFDDLDNFEIDEGNVQLNIR